MIYITFLVHDTAEYTYVYLKNLADRSDDYRYSSLSGAITHVNNNPPRIECAKGIFIIYSTRIKENLSGREFFIVTVSSAALFSIHSTSISYSHPHYEKHPNFTCVWLCRHPLLQHSIASFIRRAFCTIITNK